MMRVLPDDVRARLGNLRVCRANGISPRVLVPESSLAWFENADVRGAAVELVDDLRERVIAFAKRHEGTPYDRRATISTAPRAFSCSTLTKYAFASIGIDLPRYAVDQSYVGRRLTGRDWTPGTLVFWTGEFPVRDTERAVGHVGIAVGHERAIHAGGKRRRQSVHEFTSLRPETAIYVDPFPVEPHAIIHLPQEERGYETALDLVRSLQR